MNQIAVPGALMRGGTSKGLVLNADDLPGDAAARDALLLAAMGSPDVRQIDGVGGAHPLTSKVAVVSRSTRSGVDVEYLFLQVWPDRPEVSDSQNCGNMLAAVGPFAIETGLVAARDGVTPVRIWMTNTSSLATAHVPTPGGEVTYAGNASIDGVPGMHAPILIEFADLVGSSTGALLPTGRPRDRIAGFDVTCIDNGMPVVCLRAADLGLGGQETPAQIEANAEVRAAVERVRLAAGLLMNLGDVTDQTVPKMSLLSPPAQSGSISTRTLIPHRVHEAIGVLGAISVATACLVPDSIAAELAPENLTSSGHVELKVEHPTGSFTVGLDLASAESGNVVERAGLLRTARMLMRGDVLIPRETQ
ncbi:FldA protein [Kineosporia sp. NBRC 101677]|uniref:4-oxalomesaconate tautomerase n=1 Tax=Kineosporia sp. NBRC 101677 TaxID=3032197 RepID=UPI0024A040C4|nr:4-oxalomesaconate tautomerase [Kineosporia sp. NBRC 101677]GLY16777.1 FldA protein [Kineosporia sp. NBRC 101677]